MSVNPFSFSWCWTDSADRRQSRSVKLRPMPNSLLKRLRAAAELLELIAADWRLLDQLPAEDRQRLHEAVASVYNPDPVARRRRMKAVERERKAAGTRRDDAVLHRTGIRQLRRKPVFTTPNVFPPRDSNRATSGATTGLRRRRRAGAPGIGRAAALLCLQAEILGDPSFLRSALPRVRGS